MKRLVAILFGSIVINCFAQDSGFEAMIRTISSMNFTKRSGLVFPQGVQFEGVDGDVFLNANWNKTEVRMKGNRGLFSGLPAKYDLQNDQLNILYRNEVKVIDGGAIQRFSWLDSLSGENQNYISGTSFTFKGAPLKGFIQVLVEGRLGLYDVTTLNIIMPTYNPALSVGSKNVVLEKKIEFFYSDDGKSLKRITKKKDISEGLKAYKTEVDKYFKLNSVKVTDKESLIGLFKYLNTLVLN